MAIEAIKAAAMTYQGSVSNAAVAQEQSNKEENGQIVDASERIAQRTMDFTTKQTDADGSESESGNQAYEGGGKNNKQLQEAVEKMKKNMNNQTEAVFGIHEGTNRVMIKIVDKESKNVLKEYPPEKTLDMIQKVWEMAGIMVDEKR